MPPEQQAAATHCRLYLISPERIEHPTIFADDLRAALDGGDVAAFQLRLKDVSDDTIARAADTLRPVCQQRAVAFIMNDRPDLAVKLDCDGVHVGQEDMPYAEARRIVGADRQVGVTCKASRHLAMEAAEAGADYVAIGGITVENCRPVVAAGADFLAVAGGVWNHKDGPGAAVHAFNEIFSAHR